MAGRIDHLGLAVPNLEAAIATYTALLGAPPVGQEEVPTEQVKVAFFEAGDSRIELLEPTSSESAVGRFLERRGPGIHHICLATDDIEAELARLTAAGLRTVGEAPRPGAHGTKVAFLHPKSTHGVLIELSQKG